MQPHCPGEHPFGVIWEGILLGGRSFGSSRNRFRSNCLSDGTVSEASVSPPKPVWAAAAGFSAIASGSGCGSAANGCDGCELFAASFRGSSGLVLWEAVSMTFAPSRNAPFHSQPQNCIHPFPQSIPMTTMGPAGGDSNRFVRFSWNTRSPLDLRAPSVRPDFRLD